MISRARERRRRRHIIFGKGAALNSVTVGKTVSRRAFVEYRRFSHASLINTANLPSPAADATRRILLTRSSRRDARRFCWRENCWRMAEPCDELNVELLLSQFDSINQSTFGTAAAAAAVASAAAASADLAAAASADLAAASLDDELEIAIRSSLVKSADDPERMWKIRWSEATGRHLIATRFMKRDTVVFRETPLIVAEASASGERALRGEMAAAAIELLRLSPGGPARLLQEPKLAADSSSANSLKSWAHDILNALRTRQYTRRDGSRVPRTVDSTMWALGVASVNAHGVSNVLKGRGRTRRRKTSLSHAHCHLSILR